MASRFLTPFTGRGLLSRDPFLDFRREMDRLFDEGFRGVTERPSEGFLLSPRVDVTQRDDGWEVTAEIPGVDQKDIDLRLDGDLLTISGEKRDERKDEQNRFMERRYGTFTRSFTLPFTPDPDKVTAECDRGVLTIKLPKGAEQERSKKIAISGSKGEQPAIGQDWSKKSETEKLSEKQAEQGQGAPA